MFAIAASALYAAVRRRGTTQQLTAAIVTCAISSLLLLPAIVWYNVRFGIEQATLDSAEVEVALVYVVLWGWFLPLAITTSYFLFALPRTSTTSVHIPRQQRTTRADPSAETLAPPRRQPGIPVPYVFDQETPWGWLEYRNGRLQGQRLALKRAIITIGRGEDNDIWLDDDMASRHHAELACAAGKVYITDCDSLNGVLLNGRRIVSVALVQKGDTLEIGSHRLLFDLAQPAISPANEQDDPLAHHAWPFHSNRTSQNGQTLDPTRLLEPGGTPEPERAGTPEQPTRLPVQEVEQALAQDWQNTAEMERATPLPLTPRIEAAFIIRDGEMAGKSFLLDRPIVTIGRGTESDIVINDVSISRRHAQILRQPTGDYVQDLGSRNGTTLNGEPLSYPHLLHPGDIVCLGNIRLEYMPVQAAQTTPVPLILNAPPLLRPGSGPAPLRLPSKPRNYEQKE
ncbi:MAG TPA: FHA domain-containing protein [Ktedonobacteraceae bacterium]|nr:FHA domain-containing protein [Ktedonobacteraceae bacterium]